MLTLGEINARIAKLKDWSLEGDNITKTFKFDDFKDSINFVLKVGEIAEEINHHPDIMINYNVVRLNITSHSEGMLTEKDFQLAERIDSADFDISNVEDTS